MFKVSNHHLAPAAVLDALEYPAILLTADYRIVASNRLYRDSFGELPPAARCYEVSHGYDRPCDQAGESCPLAACKQGGGKERVLHVHNSPRGREHIDVEMIPLLDDAGAACYFIEVLKPVTIASAQANATRMVGSSVAFNQMLEMINLVARHDTSVLLLGETGTGKELAASAIHEASRRGDKSMVTVECAGLSDTLFESELFGHVKGAFTGAVSNKRGLLELARGGTLFLDEIGDVPLGMQVKLLRLLETGTYRAVGDAQVRRADFRLVCATHKDLREQVQRGEFREDLYFRINAFPIVLPPLRQRRDDIPLLARSILEKLHPERSYRLSDKAMSQLMALPFTGNIRELRNVLERATIFAREQLIDQDVLSRCLSEPIEQREPDQAVWTDLATQERRYLRQLLAHCQGDKARAAQIAGISVRSLYRRLQSL